MLLKTLLPPKKLHFFLATILFAFIGLQFFLIYSYSIDFPFSDEWDYFDTYKIPNYFDLEWLLRPYNSHPGFFEHLVSWIHYKVTSFDLRMYQLSNFFLYNFLVFSFIKIAKKMNMFFFTVILSVLPLYSCVIWEIFMWCPCLACFSFYFFGIWGLYLSNSKNVCLKMNIISACLTLLSMISFSGGVAFGAVTPCLAGINIFQRQNCKENFLKSLFYWTPHLLIVFLLIFIIISHETCPKFAPEVSLDNNHNFLPFFLTSLVGGFGIQWWLSTPELPIFLGSLYLFIIMWGCMRLFEAKDVDYSTKRFIFASIFVSLGILVLLSYGRSNGGILEALTSRYRLFSLFLIPWVFVLFSQKCFSADLKKVFLGFFLLINLMNWRTHTDTFFYKDLYRLREEGKKCLEEAHQQKDYTKMCPLMHHAGSPMLHVYESAIKMGIHFTKSTH